MASKNVPLAAPRSEEEIRAAVSSTARASVYKALGAGQSYEQAMANGLVQVSGAVSREVLNGGRDTILQEVARDPRVLGWIRTGGGRTCPFCAMLLSRGPVYKEETADFEAHDHCACGAEPVFEGSEWPAENQRLHELWNETGSQKSFRDALNEERVSGRVTGVQAPRELPSMRSHGFGDWETQTSHDLDLQDAMGTGSQEDAIRMKRDVQQSIDEHLAGDGDWQSAKDWLSQRYQSLSPDEEGWEPTLGSDWVSQWAFSSGDSHPESVALQLAARAEFGLDVASLAHIDAATLMEATRIYDEIGPGLRKFLRAQYDTTQEWFASQGIADVTAYRGMQLADRAIVDAGFASTQEMATAPLSSFTADLTTAHHFTGAVISGRNADSLAIIASRVPVTRILSIPRTGLGCLNERELVVLGGHDKTAQFVWSRSGLREFLRDPQSLRGVNDELDWLIDEGAEMSDLTYVEAVFRTYLHSLD